MRFRRCWMDRAFAQCYVFECHEQSQGTGFDLWVFGWYSQADVRHYLQPSDMHLTYELTHKTKSQGKLCPGLRFSWSG